MSFLTDIISVQTILLWHWLAVFFSDRWECKVRWPSSTFLLFDSVSAPVSVCVIHPGSGGGWGTSAWQQDKQWWRREEKEAHQQSERGYTKRNFTISKMKYHHKINMLQKQTNQHDSRSQQTCSHLMVYYLNEQDFPHWNLRRRVSSQQISFITSFNSVRCKKKAGKSGQVVGNGAPTDADFRHLSVNSVWVTNWNSVILQSTSCVQYNTDRGCWMNLINSLNIYRGALWAPSDCCSQK